MKKKLLFLFTVALGAILFMQNAKAQISVNVSGSAVTTPALAGSYPSLANALTALNAITAYPTPGAIVLTCVAGGSETAPPTGLVIGSTTLNPLLSAINTVTINKSGGTVTLNAGIGTATPSSAAPDGILSIRGADFITVDGLTLTDGNVSNPATMEFGIGLFKANLSDGAQNNTIQNCTINVKTINNALGTSPMIEGSVGILVINSTATAATTALTPVAAAGTNSGNRFYANTINGGNYGMGLIGFAGTTPFTTCDFNNDIGGSSPATGNNILDFGGGATTNPSAGIRTLAQYSINVSNNTVNNNTGANVNHATTFRGIYLNTATSANATISNNHVTLKTGATASTCTAIDNQSGSSGTTNTISITGNTVSGANTNATTGVWTGINNGSTASTVNVDLNTMSGFDLAGTGTHIMIETGSPTTATASGNSISGITRSGLSGSWRIIKTTSPTNFIANNNTIDGISYTAIASTGSVDGIYGLSSAVNVTINGNVVRNFSTPSTGTLRGIVEFGVIGLKTIQNNQVYNFYTTSGGAGGASFTGISESTGSTNDISLNQVYSLNSTGTTGGTAGSIVGISISGGAANNVYRNRICGISSTSTNPSVSGITVSGGATNTVYNNLIGDLRAPAANAANPVTGMNISGGTTNNIYYNTVNLNASSTGALFGSSAVSVSTSSTVTLRNNIFHNTSTANGTGLTVAHRRSSTTLTSYAAASNNNLFYAGTPGASNLIFYDGTNSDQTLVAYKAQVASRDAASVTENLISTPTFLSATCGNGNFLHISPSVPTQLESGGAPITGITDDYDGDLRNSAIPDIGADEFAGIAIDVTAPSIASVTLAGNSCNLVNRTVTAVLSDASGVDNAAFKPRIYFRKNGGAYISAAGSLTSGTIISGSWTFTINYALVGSVVVADVVDYFIVAQDVAGNAGGIPSGGLVLINVNTVTTPPGTPLTYAILNAIGGNYNVGAGQVYPTLTAAVSSYNSSCLMGPVTFLLTDAAYTEAAALTINANSDASAVNTLTIKPTLANTTVAVTGGSTTAIFTLNGSDYVIIDGSTGNTVNACCSTPASRDLTITNSNAGTTSAVVWLQTNGSDGATNNTVKNCNLAGSGNTQTLFGVGSGSSTISTTSLGTGNNFNSFVNNSISKTQYGIYTQGAGAAAKNTGNVISMNLINTALPNNVARGGIWTGFENNLTISCNQVDGISQTYLPDVFGISAGFGISMSATTSGGNEVTNATITKNFIGSIVNTGTFSAYGIGVCAATSGTTLIANNMISGVSANGTSGDFAGGIVLGGGAGSTTNVYYNTVSMQGTIAGTSAATQTSACLAVTNSTAPVLDLRDNIFSNTQLGNTGATLRFAAIALGYSTYTTLISNNNDLYAAGAGPGTYTIGITGTVVSGTNNVTLANWQAATGNDAASVNALPVFAGPYDLHLSPAFNPVLGDLGTPVPVTDDIDCSLRSLVTPDIGADEFLPPVCVAAAGGTASGSTSFCVSGTPVITAMGYSVGTGSTFQWISSATLSDYPNFGNPVAGQNNPATLTTGVVSATTYYWLRVTCATNASTDNSTLVTISVYSSVASISGPSAKCASDPAVTLNENGGTGTAWLWSTGETTQSIGVNPASTTVYSVTVTSPGSCTAIASKTLIVNQNPTGVTASSSIAFVCPGTPFNLFSGATITGAATILSEGFETGAAGWFFEDSLSTGTNVPGQMFHIQNAPYTDPTGAATFLNFSITGSKFVYSNPDAGGNGSFTRTKMYSPSFSTAGFTGDATLTFKHVYRYWATSVPPEQVRVSISTDGGATWTDLQSYEGSDKGTIANNAQVAVTATINVPAIYMGYPNVKLRWRYMSNWGYFWCLDDVLLTGTPLGIFSWTSTPSGFTSSLQNPVGVTETVPTNYLVTATGIGGCSSTASVNVAVLPSPTPSISPSAPVIVAGTVQSLAASIPSDPAAAITWSPVTNLYTTSGLGTPYGGEPLATVYTNSPVTITYTAHGLSMTGCTGSHDVTVTVVSVPISLLASITNVSCSGGSNGSVTTIVSGGVTPYQYLWSNLATTSSLTGLTAGAYSVTITDANSTTVTGSFVVVQPVDLGLTASTTNAACPGASDGSIDLSVAGGTPGYNYTWSNSATTQDLSGLSPGTYTVTITDLHLCSRTGSWSVGVTNPVCANTSVSGTASTTVCYNAHLTITVAGGTSTFVVSAPSGNATFIAGQNILFEPGTHVAYNAYMHGYISQNFCTNPSAPIVAAATGMDEPPVSLSHAFFTLYPNPTNGNFTLVQKGDKTYGNVKVEVYSMSGGKVMTGQMTGEKKHEFRFSEIPAGLYFVKVVADDYVETIKLIRTR